jgi:hypothetical protein
VAVRLATLFASTNDPGASWRFCCPGVRIKQFEELPPTMKRGPHLKGGPDNVVPYQRHFR